MLCMRKETGTFPGSKGGRCVSLTTLPPSCAVVMKSVNLNFLEPSGPIKACNGTALPLPLCEKKLNANPDPVMMERKPASRTSCSLCIRYTGRLFPLQESFIAVSEWKYNCLIGFTFLRKCRITKSRGRLGRNTCQPAN